MRNFIVIICVIVSFTSCSQKSQLVSYAYTDSLIKHFSLPALAKNNEQNILFWKSRIDPKNPGQVNESKYASALVTRFQLFGDIRDLKQADSVYRNINRVYNNTLASPFVALTSLALLQHHFSQADTLLEKAKRLGIDGFTRNTLSFDVDFELGHYQNCILYLKNLERNKDYNYYFRRSKLDHLNGTIDSAIAAMSKAADFAKTDPYLRDIALSNEADLYMHAGNLEAAAKLYKECLRLNNIDFHSLMGLGWIALVHDKSPALAEKIFHFAAEKKKLPDPLFKLYQTAQSSDNKTLEKKYATKFLTKATNILYGRMYNKYMIEIYTGVINNPGKAEALAKDELNNRATPQTYSWYAYTLFKNNKKEDAYKVFEQHISGKPLEGLELYYMGKLMRGIGKGIDANAFFKAADKNKYDLSPALARDLETNLEK
jgi:hypothetical protein